MKIQSIKLLTALILLFLINSCSDENNSADKLKTTQDENVNQKSQNIAAISTASEARLNTKNTELNRVLGGGIQLSCVMFQALDIQ